jgi:hypothetical protein
VVLTSQVTVRMLVMGATEEQLQSNFQFSGWLGSWLAQQGLQATSQASFHVSEVHVSPLGWGQYDDGPPELTLLPPNPLVLTRFKGEFVDPGGVT